MSQGSDIPKIPGYRVARKLGSGAMASVYLARHELLNRNVAVKIMDRELAQSRDFAKRFLQEGRTVAALTHTNIITIYDLGLANGLPYLTMECIQEGDLKARINAGITPEKALDILVDIALGLAYAHKNNIIHRDIKPTNILFRHDTPIISDFGIAKQQGMESHLTSTGMFVGTPLYMSPEQAQDRPFDGRTDIYSLGILFYEMLTGSPPYEADSVISTILQHVQGPIPVLPGVLHRYQGLLNALIAKNPKDRFATGDEVVSAVRAVQAGKILRGREVVEVHSSPLNWRRQSYLKMGVIASLLLALLLALFAWWPAPVPQVVEEVQPLPPTPTPTVLVEKVEAPPQAVLENYYTEVPDEPVLQPQVPVAPEPQIEPELEVEPEFEPATSNLVDVAPVEERIVPTHNADKIARLLEQAEESLDSNRLTTPLQSSAVYYFSQALNLDPTNEYAFQGFQRIADKYVALAEQQLVKRHYVQAKAYINKGLGVLPDYGPLLILREVLSDKEHR